MEQVESRVVEAHGARIPRIGLGTWALRGGECTAAVAAAIETGYRHIDTAAAYGNEKEVGEGLRRSAISRDEVFVTTKVWPDDLADGALQRSAEQSLQRLGLDVVDLLLIHWPSRTIPVAATIRSLNDAKRRGLTRHIGVSNFTTKLLAEAWDATQEPLVTNQCEYHPHLNQDNVLAACREGGMSFTAYSPLGRRAALGERAITDIAARLGRSPAQVALRWLIQQRGVVAIPKSATPVRIRDNLNVFDFTLDPRDMAAIGGLARPGGRILQAGGSSPDWDA
jgi:2,5-diketo-D-gluconate reductase B